MVKNLKSNYQAGRDQSTAKWRFLILAQVLILTFLSVETCTASYMTAEFKVSPDSAGTVITRFLCAVFLHIILIDEIKQGFEKMNYANNHWWKFRNWWRAYFTGFCQMFIVIQVELVNLAILNTNQSILDIIMNFLALVVLSEFDNFFFKTIATTVFGKVLEGYYQETTVCECACAEKENKETIVIDLDKLLKIEVTTSRMAN